MKRRVDGLNLASGSYWMAYLNTLRFGWALEI